MSSFSQARQDFLVPRVKMEVDRSAKALTCSDLEKLITWATRSEIAAAMCSIVEGGDAVAIPAVFTEESMAADRVFIK